MCAVCALLCGVVCRVWCCVVWRVGCGSVCDMLCAVCALLCGVVFRACMCLVKSNGRAVRHVSILKHSQIISAGSVCSNSM